MYCSNHALDESSPSAINLVNFLQSEADKGKQYRTINTYRSAVSSTLGTCPVRGTPVGQDPLVSRFMKGLLRLKPPKTHVFPNWDLMTVLDKLVSWGNFKQLSLPQLLKKTAFLVAVVSYKRPADLCNMKKVKGYWQLDSTGFSCQPLGFGKTEQHRPVPPLRIEPFVEKPNLCPVLHLVELDERYSVHNYRSFVLFFINTFTGYQSLDLNRCPSSGFPPENLSRQYPQLRWAAGCER